MEPFKNLLNPALVEQAALRLQGPRFDGRRFAALARHGLESLEMKARAMHICGALESTLPADFDAAADLLQSALAAPSSGASNDASNGVSSDAPGGTESGLRGWILWPVGEYVARHGQQHPRRALALLHALTQVFTAEFAIRPFIVRHPALVFETLAGWCSDQSPHVRRLVSEGSRPRLPWGLQLKSLIEDPSPTLPLLRALQDDPSDYVRRSVANHLNDIAKDHPVLIAAWLAEHLPQAGPQRRALLKHASRTLIKRGDVAVLRAWGLAGALRGEATLALAPSRVTLGGATELTVQLKSNSPRKQRLAIDYVVHHVKAGGSTSPKVFKGWLVELPPWSERTLTRRHSLKPITTRRYHAGRHVVSVQANGRTVAEAAFELSLPPN